MISRISRSVSRMPSRAMRPTVRMVLSTPFFTMPSPEKNWFWPWVYISYPMSPASTAMAIFPAQEGLAPSQTMPERMARVFTMVWAMTSYPSPWRYAMPAAAPQPALTAPQKAESRPMLVF